MSCARRCTPSSDSPNCWPRNWRGRSTRSNSASWIISTRIRCICWTLINDILDISKIESGRLELRRETFDLGVVLEETLSSVRPQAAAKSIAIETSLSIPSVVFADRMRVKQVLFNLLSNALKFTPEGGKVRVEAALRDGFVEISVSDTGIGIPKDQHRGRIR